MADIITGTTTGFVNNTPEQTLATLSDIRREAAEHSSLTVATVKDSRHDVVSAVANEGDRVLKTVTDNAALVMDRFFDVGRDTQDIRAQVISQQQQLVAGFAAAAKDSEINALKTQIEIAKQTTYLSDKIDSGNETTVALINSLKETDLNRMLIERNAALVEEAAEGRHWRYRADQGQWQALSNQLQAFQSQLQETRQGMVNFGTMAGVGQSSTSNNVR